MQGNISNKLTKYLAIIMVFSVTCLFFVALYFSYGTYNMLFKKWNAELATFVEGIIPATTRDLQVKNLDALKIRTEFLIMKERARNIQVKISPADQLDVYISDDFDSTYCTDNGFSFKKKITICNEREIEHSGQMLGRIFVTQEIRSFYAFFVDSNMPVMFLVLVGIMAVLLVVLRYLLKVQVLVPLKTLIQNLEENQNLSSDKNSLNKAQEWVVLDGAITEYKEKIVNYVQEQNKISKDLEKEKLMSEVTAQLVHDIRSPLAALDMMAANIPELDEEKRVLIRNATARIHNIANNLLDRNFTRNNNVSTQMFSSLIRSMLFEKREQYKSKPKITIHENVDERAYGAFAKIDLNDFKRMLSNLVDNSVQAIPSTGFVKVALTQNEQNVVIEVFDNGKGIPPENLASVTEKGFTKKKEGSGLGLYFVSQKMKELGGSLQIESQVNVGTTIRLILKKEPPPAWFVSEIQIKDDTQYVVLDDDDSIHEMWKNKFLQATRKNVKMKHFEDEQSFREWYVTHKNQSEKTTYLFDYELIGNANSGLDIIEKYHINQNAILVTSHYENADIQKRCERIGVKMIPKEMAGFVPVIAAA